MDIKLAVFDLDGTLAGIGEPMEAPTIAALFELQSLGVQLALSSGKPCAHLCGFLRQAGLPEVIMMGENGAVTQFGIDLPPKRHSRLPVSKEAMAQLAGIRTAILDRVRPVPWFQPNEVVLTMCFEGEAQYQALKALLAEQLKEDMGLQLFEHVDSFDICPEGINKGHALKQLMLDLGLQKHQVAAIGDGANDLPLWQKSGLAVQIGSTVKAPVHVQVPDILAAIAAVRKRTQSLSG